MSIPWSRWAMKKAARAALALASRAAGALSPAGPGRRPHAVRALMYHRFGEATRDPWCVGAAVFEGQIRHVAERRLAVSLADVVRFARGEVDLPDGAVLITIDDGYASVLDVAAPVLARHGVPAVAFVSTGLLGGVAPCGERYLAWPEVAQLSGAGITVGSHAHTHRSLGRLPAREVHDEARRSKELLEDRLGAAVDAFAYPYGTRLDENRATAEVLRACGYLALFTAQHGAVRAGADLARLPRVKIEGGDPDWLFGLACGGALDAWRAVDTALWRLGWTADRPAPCAAVARELPRTGARPDPCRRKGGGS